MCPSLGTAKGRLTSPLVLCYELPIMSVSELFFRLGSVNGTYTRAGTAFETFVGIDNVLTVLFGNTFYRTFSSAGTAADAVITNFVSHSENTSVSRYLILSYL